MFLAETRSGLFLKSLFVTIESSGALNDRHFGYSVFSPQALAKTPLRQGNSPFKPLKEAGKRLSKRGCLSAPVHSSLNVGFDHGNVLSTNGLSARDKPDPHQLLKVVQTAFFQVFDLGRYSSRLGAGPPLSEVCSSEASLNA